MSNKTTEITTMVVEADTKPNPNPIFPFFPNFNFNLQFPFFPPKHNHHTKNKPSSIIPKLQEEEHAPIISNTNVVTFPKTQLVVPSPLQAEPDSHNSTTKTSNPLILYQVYAIGGFFISRWIWARWNERKARGKSPNDDGRGSQDNE